MEIQSNMTDEVSVTYVVTYSTVVLPLPLQWTSKTNGTNYLWYNITVIQRFQPPRHLYLLYWEIMNYNFQQ